MKKSIKKKLVTALRSGEYKQGKETLAPPNTGTFCCLGVMCKVMGVGFKGTSGLPCETTLKKAGLNYRQARLLATMNDEGNSFKTIATFIEKNL